LTGLTRFTEEQNLVNHVNPVKKYVTELTDSIQTAARYVNWAAFWQRTLLLAAIAVINGGEVLQARRVTGGQPHVRKGAYDGRQGKIAGN